MSNFNFIKTDFPDLYADAVEAENFGSVIRGEDTGSSDLDLLVDPMPATSLT